MSKSPYKREPDGAVVGLLQSRAATLRSGPHMDAATRNPAWVQIIGNGMELPKRSETFEGEYKPDLKPKPSLTNVRIVQGGDFGLILELEASIMCYLLSDFQKVEQAFLMPGTNIQCNFGYAKPRGSGYKKNHSFKGFKVATYSFNTTPEGFWEAKFKAVAPGIAANKVDMAIKLKTPFKFKVGSKTHPVEGLAQLIAYDAQVNGEVGIDKMADGQVIIPSGGGAMVVYHPDHLQGMIESIFSGWGQSNQVTETDNIVYMTLEYVIDRLVNGQIFTKTAETIAAADKADFKKLKIKFDPELSKSYPDSLLRSAWPTEVLFLGEKAGDYLNSESKGRNFEDISPLDPVKAVEGKSNGRMTVDLKKILLNRSVVLGALNYEYTKPNKAATNDLKETEEGLLDFHTFFMKLSNEIARASGGMIKLRLSMHPDIHKGEGNHASEIYIFDENNGKMDKSIPCLVFNPIDGDGSTRTCGITSDVGGQEYQAYMFGNQIKKNVPSMEAAGKCVDGAVDTAGIVRSDAAQSIMKLLNSPGALGDDRFAEIHMKSLEGILGTLRKVTPSTKKHDMLVYPGLGITIELDGIFGIYPGCAISTRQLPARFRTAKTYFFVESVDHSFQGNDWATTIAGKLSFNNDVEYKYI